MPVVRSPTTLGIGLQPPLHGHVLALMPCSGSTVGNLPLRGMHWGAATYRAAVSGPAIAGKERNGGAAEQQFEIPHWVDVLLVMVAIGLCSAAEHYMGTTVAAWGAVTVVVLTGLEVDPFGRPGRKKGLLRIAGTAVGGIAGTLGGPSWTRLAVWVGTLAMLKIKAKPSLSYAFVVSAFTYAVVAFGADCQAMVRVTATQRLLGVSTGMMAILLTWAFRKVFKAASEVSVELAIREMHRSSRRQEVSASSSAVKGQSQA